MSHAAEVNTEALHALMKMLCFNGLRMELIQTRLSKAKGPTGLHVRYCKSTLSFRIVHGPGTWSGILLFVLKTRIFIIASTCFSGTLTPCAVFGGVPVTFNTGRRKFCFQDNSYAVCAPL